MDNHDLKAVEEAAKKYKQTIAKLKQFVNEAGNPSDKVILVAELEALGKLDPTKMESQRKVQAFITKIIK